MSRSTQRSPVFPHSCLRQSFIILILIALAPSLVRAECNNSAPQALADEVATLDVLAVVIDPLANDFDAEGQPLSLQYLGDSCFGAVSVGDDTLTLTPLAGVAESCTISYRARDTDGASTPGSIAVTVTLFDESVFLDGFEIGNTSNWSTTVVE